MLRKLALWILGIKESDIHKDLYPVLINKGEHIYIFYTIGYIADTMRGCEWRLIIDKSKNNDQ